MLSTASRSENQLTVRDPAASQSTAGVPAHGLKVAAAPMNDLYPHLKPGEPLFRSRS
jgi:hypothetical protein